MTNSSIPLDLDELVRDALEPYLLGGEDGNITIVSEPPDVSVSCHSKSPIFNGFDLNRLTTAFNEKVFNRTWYAEMTQVFDGYDRDPGDNEMITSSVTYVNLYILHGTQ